MKWSDLEKEIPTLLNNIHDAMYQKAVDKRDESIVVVTSFEEMKQRLDQKVLFLVPWCETVESEEEIKK